MRLRLPHPVWLAIVAVLLLVILWPITVWYRGSRHQRLINALEEKGCSVEQVYSGPMWCVSMVDWLSEYLGEDLSATLANAFLAVHAVDGRGQTSPWLFLIVGQQRIEIVRLDGEFDSEDLKPLNSLPHLEALDASFCKFTNGSLSKLTECKELRRVNHNGATLQSVDLQVVRNWPQLVRLDLRESSIDDDALAALDSAIRLERLDLDKVQLKGTGLSVLGKLRQLQWLSLNRTSVSGSHWLELAGCGQLKRLELRGANIKDEQLAVLSALSQLEYLDLQDTEIDGSGLVALSRLTSLSALNLEHAPINDRGVTAIAGLSSLELLCMNDTSVSDAGMMPLRGLKKLKCLLIPEFSAKNAGWKQLCSDLSWMTVDPYRKGENLLIAPGYFPDKDPRFAREQDSVFILGNSMGGGFSYRLFP